MFENPKILWLIEDLDTYLWYYVSERIGQVKIFESITDEDYWTSNAYEAVGFDTENEAREMIEHLRNNKSFEGKRMDTTDHMFL